MTPELLAQHNLTQEEFAAAAEGLLRSAHDPSEGRLAVTHATYCFRGEETGLGARRDLVAHA